MMLYPARLLILGMLLIACPAHAQTREHWVQIAAAKDGPDAIYVIAKAATSQPSIMQAFENDRVRIHRHTDSRATYLRVVVGPFVWVDAVQFCDDLKSAKQDCIVR